MSGASSQSASSAASSGGILAETAVSEARPGVAGGRADPAGVGRFRRAPSLDPEASPLTVGLDTRTQGLAAAGTPIDREDLPLRKSLISQIIKQLSAAGSLTAIKPLANRDGCVNTIASLLGELQRAGKTAEEFARAIEERQHESNLSAKFKFPSPRVPSPKSILIEKSR